MRRRIIVNSIAKRSLAIELLRGRVSGRGNLYGLLRSIAPRNDKQYMDKA